MELYSLSRSLRLLDSILALSLEALGAPQDLVSDYALTLGKSSQGVTTFKNAIQALTDKSKLLSTGTLL